MAALTGPGKTGPSILPREAIVVRLHEPPRNARDSVTAARMCGSGVRESPINYKSIHRLY